MSGEKWPRTYSSYSNEELRVVSFPSVRDFRRALRLFWEDSDLKGCPRDTYSGMEFIVPAEAADLIQKRSQETGIRIRAIENVIGAGDLPLDRLAQFRREHGM